jgi:polysaccharide transporter, PST family
MALEPTAEQPDDAEGSASPGEIGDADGEIWALKRRSVHGTATTFVAQGCRAFLKLAGQIVIARLLLPADYGLIAMVGPILSLTYLMGELGLGQAVIFEREITLGELSALFWLSLLLNTALAGCLALLSPGIAWLYHEPRTIPITLVLSALLPVSGLAVQHIALLTRNLRFGALAVLDVAPPAAGMIIGFAAAWFGWAYWSLVAFTIVETLTTVCLAWSLSGWCPSRPAYDRRVKRLIQVGFHLTGYNLASYATTSFDNILLGATHGSAPLGLYDRGYKLVVQPITQLTTPVGRIAMPLLTRLRPDASRYKRAYLDMLRIMLLIVVPGVLAVMMMAQPLILFLLGTRWLGVAPVFAWLCLGGLASPIYASTFWLFTTQERTRQQTAYVAATSVISVVSFVAGLPWGPVGVAAGGGLSFLLISTPLTCWGATKKGLVTTADLALALLPFLIAGLATIAALEFARNYLAPGGVITLVISAALSYAVFIGALLCLPIGQPIIRRAWHLGLVLSQGA